jgi:hypothetical protein
MQAIRKQIGVIGHPVLQQGIVIFSGLIAGRKPPSPGTLKFRHVRYRTVDEFRILDRSVSDGRVGDI